MCYRFWAGFETKPWTFRAGGSQSDLHRQQAFWGAQRRCGTRSTQAPLSLTSYSALPAPGPEQRLESPERRWAHRAE